MRLSYDPAKRAWTLAERRLDFNDAAHVFAGRTIDVVDDRKNYGEVRWVTYGLLNGRMLSIVWTPRGRVRHIISMRKTNDREQQTYRDGLGS